MTTQAIRKDLPVSYKTQIYVLKHPITGEIRYVGKTSRTLHARLWSHKNQAKRPESHCQRWIHRLAAEGLEPVIELVDEVEGNGNCAERKWIVHYRDLGCRLTNITDGGDGWSKGQKHSEETKAKMRKPKSASHAQAISNAKKGSGHHLAKLNEEAVYEIKDLLETDLTHGQIAARYGVSRTCISLINNGTTWSHL